jgi:hypothetical protein
MSTVTPNNYIGSSIDPSVSTQIAKRKELLESRARSIDWNIVNTSNTAWVKLSSSVDIGGSTNTPAIAYKLSATGINGDSSLNPGYDLDKGNLGFRPVPGITDVNITAQNRFGTLRTATVSFKAYTVEQLDYLEQLYMRPGFSILLEWGHSTFINNSGDVIKTPQVVGDSYFTAGAFDKDKIQKRIQELRKTNSHNYDGMFGYVKNFVWSFNTDGSYNCSVDIVSIGEILESLKFLIPGKPVDEDVDTEKNKTGVHDVLKALTAWLETPEGETEKVLKETLNSVGLAGITIPELTYRSTLAKVKVGEENTGLSYIQFDALVNFINAVATIKDNNDRSISKVTIHPEATFNTFPKHISGNPGVVVIPKSTPLVNELLKGIYDYGEDFTKLFTNTSTSSDFDKIGDLYLNIDHVLTSLDMSLDENLSLDVLRFYRTLLISVDKALGYITELDLAYEEEFDTYYIVDRRYTALQDKLTTIPVTGLGTTVTNISMTSKLSPSLGSMIAITAQASRDVSDVGLEAENLFKWNKGLTDRIVPEKQIGSTSLTANLHDKAQVAFEKVISAFRNGDYVRKDFEDVHLSHKLITQTDFRDYLRTTSGKESGVGIIPFELNLTLKGIGGLKIGQAFKLGGKILPKKYRNEVAFLINGLEHSIKEGKWETVIKAQTINNPGS